MNNANPYIQAPVPAAPKPPAAAPLVSAPGPPVSVVVAPPGVQPAVPPAVPPVAVPPPAVPLPVGQGAPAIAPLAQVVAGVTTLAVQTAPALNTLSGSNLIITNSTPNPLLQNEFLGWTSGVLNITNISLLIFVLILIFIAIILTCVFIVYLIRCCCRKGEKHRAMYQKMPSLYVDQLPGFGADGDAQTFGMVEYSLEYNMKSHELKVGVIQVMDLFINAATESMDIYLKVTLDIDAPVDTAKKNKHEKPKVFNTGIKRNCLSAAFNEEFVFKVPYEQLKSTTVRLVAYDYDAYAKDTVVGGLSLRLQDVPMENYVGKDYETTGYLTTSTGADEEPGQMCVVITNMPKVEELHVNVLEARQLNLPFHGKKIPDTMVSVTLHIGKKKLMNKKTSTRSNTMNPYFGEILVFPVKQDKLIVADLTLSVKYKGHGGILKTLGKVMLGSTVAEASSQKQWTEMLTNPTRPIAMWHAIFVKKTMEVN